VIGKFLIFIARYLDSNKRYKKTKEFFYNLLENDSYKYKKIFDIFMIFMVLSSVFVLLYDVKNELGKFLYIYDVYVVTTIFIIEYLLRLWIYNDNRRIILDELEEATFLNREFNTKKVFFEIVKKKFEYMITPFAIIDLLAILPAFRELRIFRVFMLFRLFKVLRYTHSVNNFLSIVTTKKFEILTLLMLVSFIVFIGGAIIYVFEYGKNPNIHNFFDALYWSLVTISTVGFGDISPVTYQGRVLTMFLIIAGIAFISFATSIIASAFAERLQEMKLNRIETEARKLKEFYLICGYSKITELIAENFRENKEKFIIVDSNEEKISEATNKGFLALKADVTKKEILELFNFKNIKYVMILTDDDIINTFLTLSLHSYALRTKIISIANDERNREKIKKAGANIVLNPTKALSSLVKEYIGNPVSFEVITTIFKNDSRTGVDEIEVLENSFLENKFIGEIEFKRYKLILVGIVKTKKDKLYNHTMEVKDKYFYFNPDSDVILEKGDILLIIGDDRSIKYFKYNYVEKPI
jgi:voltage-gated potassium channel